MNTTRSWQLTMTESNLYLLHVLLQYCSSLEREDTKQATSCNRVDGDDIWSIRFVEMN